MDSNLRIGDLKFDNPFFLAPLAGITDAPMRLLSKEQGASLVYSEMISGKGLWYGDRNTKSLLFAYPEEGPFAVQLFGKEPDVMREAVKQLNSHPCCIFDFNIGCPVPKVVKNGEGSALMKNPDLIYEILSQMVKWSDKPVTAKIRLGWDQNTINAVEVAKAIESAGASAICVHGRTRQDFYQGEANWEEIGKVKAKVNIPIIGNGDVTNWESAKKLMEVSGCDFVMVGRGALGNPWIFAELVAGWEGREIPSRPTSKQRCQTILRHLDLVKELKGENVAIREMRKHIGWYIKGIKGAAKLRGAINQIDDYEELKKNISEIFHNQER